MKSIEYYNTHANDFIENTNELDLSVLYNDFLGLLDKKAHILDLGCGSGRDSRYFTQQGYQTTSMDGSLELVKYCRTHLNTPVIHATFDSFNSYELYDGIWACASLLHVERGKMISTLNKFIGFLKPNGVFYMSFKNYIDDFEYESRYFTCFTLEGLTTLLSEIKHIEVLTLQETLSAKGDGLKWVSALIKRSDSCQT